MIRASRDSRVVGASVKRGRIARKGTWPLFLLSKNLPSALRESVAQRAGAPS